MTGNGKGFEIVRNETRHMLRIRVWGEWDRGLAQKFQYALQEKAEDLETDGNNWYALIDLTGITTQSQDVWEAIAAYLENSEIRGMHRIAYVRPEPSAYAFREQYRTGGWFQTVAEALHWLLTPEERTQVS